MPEWLLEDGIGEQRGLLVENGTAVAAKCRWPGELHSGQLVTAKLASRAAGSSRGVGVLDDGREVWIDRLPRNAAEGASIELMITRGAIAETGRFKLPAARPADREKPCRSSDPLSTGRRVRRLPAGAWEEIWDAAWTGEMHFAGGSLICAATPAMTLIDIDGDAPSRQLAQLAVPHVARAIRQFDIGGAIGIDFPTLPEKDNRRAINSSLEAQLADWPHERTAMNGFGFVQIVARLEGPSLLHRMAAFRLGAAARMMLRRAEMVDGPGVTLLTVHPALLPAFEPEWLDQLARRTGRPVRMMTDPGLALDGGFAQALAA